MVKRMPTGETKKGPGQFKPVEIQQSLFKKLKTKGLVSIEKLNPKDVHILSLENLKGEGFVTSGKALDTRGQKEKNEEKRKRKIVEVLDKEEKELHKPKVKKMKKEVIKKKMIEKKKLKKKDSNSGEKRNIHEKCYKKEGSKKTLIGKKRFQKESNNKEEQRNINEECHKKERSNKKLKEKNREKKNEKKGKSKINEIKTTEEKRKRFDINSILKNEQSFQKLEDADFKTHAKKWSKNNTIPIYYSILRSLYDNKLFMPYEIQEKTLKESVKNKKDIIVISKTGTGKTLTFCLPILNGILSYKIKEYERKKKCISKLRFLILVPTRELALQIMNHFHLINKYTNIYYVTIIGGISMKKQLRLINKKPEGIICTPGRLRFFLENEKVEEDEGEEAYAYIRNMKHVRYFVCDELDKMVETSFTLNIRIITKHLYQCLEEKVKFLQTILSSATLGLCAKIEEDKLAKLIHSIHIRKKKSFLVDLSEKNANEKNHSILPEGLTLNIIKCEKKVTLLNLFYFLRSYILGGNTLPEKEAEQTADKNFTFHAKKIIVFVNTIMSAKELKRFFSLLFFEPNIEGNLPKKYKSNLVLKEKINTFCIHSKLEQKKRIESIDKFVQCKNHAIIFCTDVLSRGIDLHKCDLIIQMNCPYTNITFVHRSGRTARKFKQGLCVCFVNEEEIANWKSAFNKIGLNLDDIKENEHIKKFKGDEYKRLGQAFQICKEIDELCNQVKVEKKSFIDKLAEEAELIDEDDSSLATSTGEDGEELRKTNKNEIYKRMKFLKKEMYHILYDTQ